MHFSEILAAVGYGPYVSPWKILTLLVVLLLWAKLLSWADKDADETHLPRFALNTAFLGGMVLAFFLFLMLPGFPVAFTAFMVIFLGEVVAYLVLRNQKVGLADLGKQLKASLGGNRKKKAAKIEAGEVALLDKKGTPFVPSEDPESPDGAAYAASQMFFTDALKRGAERIEMKPNEAGAIVRYTVDGVAVEGRSIPKDDAAAAVLLLKRLAGLDINDRRKPQTGMLKTTMDGKKRELQLTTAGTTAGESVTVEVEPKKRYELRIDQVGFSPEQLEIVEQTIGEGEGIVLVAAPKANGLTALLYAILRRHDAFLTHIQTVERSAMVDLEGITQNPCGPAQGEEAKQVNWVTSQEPDILAIDKVEDPRSAADLIKFASSGRRVYIGMRCGGVFEALDQWKALVGDDKLAVKHLKLIVAGRLVRKLCNACKMDYNPDPDTLRKLNMPPEKVGKLYTARNTPLRDNRGREVVCEFCLDLRFKGRTGVFELFAIDDDVRAVIQQGGSVNQLKMVFKKQRQRYLLENALAKAVAGDTSLNEITRVMRAGDSGSSSGGSSSGKPPSSGGAPRSSTPRPPSSSSSAKKK